MVLAWIKSEKTATGRRKRNAINDTSAEWNGYFDIPKSISVGGDLNFFDDNHNGGYKNVSELIFSILMVRFIH